MKKHLFLVPLLACIQLQAQIVQTFSYTGSMQNFTVPACVSVMTVQLRGAQGGDAAYPGGNGGAVQGVISVTPGQLFNIFIGGKGTVTIGGYNGGGNGGGLPATVYGAGGGGATDITLGGSGLTSRIMVASGGGGSGGNTNYQPYPGVGGGGSFCNSPYGYGGQGGSGCTTGGNGDCNGGTAFNYGTGGAGGGLTGGGAISGATVNLVDGVFGTAGTLGNGGDGGNEAARNGGGGGGGGYYGGAGGMSGIGGCNGGGGGGSSYANDNLFSNISFTAGLQSGNGLAVISYYQYLPPSGVTSVQICPGSPVTLTTAAAAGYTWSTGANNQNIIVSPTVSTNYTVESINTLGCVTSTVYSVILKPLPELYINSGISSIYIGSGTTPLSSSAPWVYNFSDPTPPNTRVKKVTLAFDAVDQGWGGSGEILRFYLTGNRYIGGVVLSHSVQPFVITSTGPFPGYVKNGNNTLSMTFAGYPGWQAFMTNATLTIQYDTGTLTACAGNAVTLTASGTGTNHTWSHGVNNGSAHTPSASAIYTVSSNGSNGCTASSTLAMIVNPVPTLNISGPSTVCAGYPTTHNVSGADSYTWSTGGTGNSLNLTPNVTTTITATGAYSLSGCTASASRTLTVFQNPTITVANYTVCNGNSVTLTPSGAVTYTYSSGSPLVSPASQTSYSITGSSAAGCISSNTAVSTVTVHAIPVLSVNSGSICSGNSFSIIPSGAQTYTITGGSFNVSPVSSTSYTIGGISAQGCAATLPVVSSLTVHNRPTVAATAGSVCAGGSFAIVPSGASTYTITGNNFTVSPPNTTSYSITGTNSQGCTSSNTAVSTITVQALPVISVNSGSICSGSNFVISPSGGATYTVTGNNFTVSPAVNSSYSVTGSSAAGCVSSNTAVSTVTVHAIPVLSVNSGSICSGNSFSIIPSGAQSYTINGGSFNVSPSSSTSYTIGGSSAQGCAASVPVVSSLTVHNRPTVAATAGSICSGGSFAIVPSGASTYTITGNNFTVSPPNTTSYSVTGTSSLGCSSSNTAVSTITVHALPVISVNSGSICSGSNFVISPSGGATYSVTGNNFTVSPALNSSYSVTGSSAAGCVSSNTAVSTVTVHAIPVVSVNSGSICSGNSFSIIPSGAQSYTVTGGSFNVSPVSSTSYSVSGTNSLGCVSAVPAVADVTVHSLPVITVNSGAICAGAFFTIVPSGAANYTITGNNFTVSPSVTSSYSVTGSSSVGCAASNTAVATVTVQTLPVISVNSGSICAGNNFVILPSGADSYTVTGGSFTVNPLSDTSYSITGASSAGCVASNTAVSTVSVHALPVIAVNSGSICAGSSFTIVPSGAQTYTITGGSFQVNPTVTSSYSVTGTSSVGCISAASAVSEITVQALPVIAVNSGSICEGGSFVIVPSGGANYTITGNNFTVSPSQTSTYNVTGTGALGCPASNTAVSTVNVNSLPVVTAQSSRTFICAGDTLTFSVSGASSYSWSSGPGHNQAFSPTATGNFTVTGADAAGCSNTAVIGVTVNPLPVLTVNQDPAGCPGATGRISVAGANSFIWNTGDTGPVLVVAPLVPVTYTVTGADLSGCINSISVTRTVNPCLAEITTNIVPRHVSCNGRKDGGIRVETVVSNPAHSITYLWQPPEICPGNNCAAIDSLGSGSYELTMIITYTVNGNYVVTDTIIGNTITINENTGPCQLRIFNLVTPNRDGRNDTWYIENISEFPGNRVSIYNRWGMPVFETKSYDNETNFWPGAEDLSKLQSTTYFYIIEPGDGSQPLKGWLELIK